MFSRTGACRPQSYCSYPAIAPLQYEEAYRTLVTWLLATRPLLCDVIYTLAFKWQPLTLVAYVSEYLGGLLPLVSPRGFAASCQVVPCRFLTRLCYPRVRLSGILISAKLMYSASGLCTTFIGALFLFSLVRVSLCFGSRTSVLCSLQVNISHPLGSALGGWCLS